MLVFQTWSKVFFFNRQSEASTSPHPTSAECSREITTRSFALLCPLKLLEQDSSRQNQVQKIKNLPVADSSATIMNWLGDNSRRNGIFLPSQELLCDLRCTGAWGEWPCWKSQQRRGKNPLGGNKNTECFSHGNFRESDCTSQSLWDFGWCKPHYKWLVLGGSGGWE